MLNKQTTCLILECLNYALRINYPFEVAPYPQDASKYENKPLYVWERALFKNYFSYFSTKAYMYAVGTQKNRLNEIN